MFLTLLGAGFASFINVFFRAFQQLNVMHDRRAWVLPCSYVMSACEVFIVTTIAVTQSYWLILPIGTAAGVGCLLSMSLHKYLRNKELKSGKYRQAA
jgi:hypothetical protein